MTSSVAEAIRAALPSIRVLDQPSDMSPYLSDWRNYWTGHAEAVLLPMTVEEVAAAVRLCNELNLSIVPQGGNTSLCGGATPLSTGPAVVIALTRMNRIRKADRLGGVIVAEAGCTVSAIHEAAEAIDRSFPLSFGAEGSAQIGGALSTNAGGTNVLKYGNARDLVLGLEVVLPDGSIWNGLRELRKDNTGYGLKHLFIGAEGTLGIITAAVLKHYPRPKDQTVAWVAAETPGHAVQLFAQMQERFDSRLSAFEMMSRRQVELVTEHLPGARCPLDEKHSWHVLVELSETIGGTTLQEQFISALGEASDAGIILDAAIAQSEKQVHDFWHIRHGLSDVNRAHGITVPADVSVPISKVPEFIADADRIVAERFPEGMVLVIAHLGDGNIHYMVQYAHELWETLPQKDELKSTIADALNDIAMANGGSFSAEHGVGVKLAPKMERYKSSTELGMMRAIKQAFDPKGRFNPGKVLP